MPPVELIVNYNYMEKILSLMLSGGEYLFSGCKKKIDFFIYM